MRASGRRCGRAGWTIGLGATCLAACGTLAFAQLTPRTKGPGDPDLPWIEVVELTAAPVIDGKLDDACWQGAKVSDLFQDEYAFPAKSSTRFRIGQKDGTLYVAVQGDYDPAKPPKEPPWNTSVKDGCLWQGEEYELFFDVDNDETPGYYQFALTPQGTTGDWFNPQPKDPEGRWEPQYQVKGHWTPQAWTAEWAIPLAAFDRTKTVHDNIGFNAFRLHAGTSCWAPNRSEGFHTPHKFGEIRGIKGPGVKPYPAGRFRSPHVNVNDRVIKAPSLAPLLPTAAPVLTAGPTLKPSGAGATIDFAVNVPTDVAVWIEDAQGERVRHLAAGKLGPNAPAPLKKDSLTQSLTWDYRDDRGKRVAPGACTVKVGVGSQAKLERVIGWNPTPKNVQGIAVDPQGRTLVVGGIRDEWCEVQRFDKAGQYDGMLFPPPANVPPEKLLGLNIVDLGAEGQIRWGSHRSAAYLPHLDQPMPHTPLVNSKGQVVIYGGEYLGGPTRLYKINADGSLPPDFLGPYVKDFTWQQYFDAWAKRFHFAFDPQDESVIYVSGLKELHRHEYGNEGELQRETWFNAVCWLKWGEDGPLETFAGKRNRYGREGGKAPGEFVDPQGIAFDKEGNLWVCDRGNDRLQVLDRKGKPVRQIAHPKPCEVRISQKTGAAYVLSLDGPEIRLTRLGANPQQSPTLVLGKSLNSHGTKNAYYWTMQLDESGPQPELVVVKGDRVEPYEIVRIADEGAQFGAPRRIVGDEAPREYKRVAAGWESDVVWAGGPFFDGNTGKLLGDSGSAGEVAASRDGRWFTYGGFWPEGVNVYPPDWPTKGRTPAEASWRLDPPALARAGSRGFCVAPDGDVYVARYYQWQGSASGRAGTEGSDMHVAIDHYAPDGKMKRQRIVYELSHAAAGPAVDVKGNIFVVDNVGRRIGEFHEPDVAANLPSWVHRCEVEWETIRQGKPIPLGYEKFVYDPLIKSVGTLYKFGPSGGGLIWRAAQGPYEQLQPIIKDPKNPLTGNYLDWGFPSTPIPKRPATHWSAAWVTTDKLEGMYPRWQEGVEFEFLGVAPHWGRYDKGHSSCTCGNVRISVDDFGRTYVPAAHRSTVRMIDAAGNEILRIGRYGNMDAAGPGSRDPGVAIPLLFPSATSLSKRALYVTEWRHARVLKVKLGYAQEKSLAATVP